MAKPTLGCDDQYGLTHVTPCVGSGFFSVGTNDLYTLAVDRGNPMVAHLYAPLHPAIIQLLERISAGQMADIDVTMCGEMAGEALCLPIVLGLGFRTLSMNPSTFHSSRP